MTRVLISWGEMLREIRKANHLKQSEIASILHVSRQDYGHIERGIVRPSPEMISILSNLYDKDLFLYALDRMPENLVNEQKDFKTYLNSIQTGKKKKKNPAKRRIQK